MGKTVLKTEIQTSGTANVSGIEWVRHGNTVTMSCYNVQSTGSAVVVLTGPPAAKNPYVVEYLYQDATYKGYLCYIDGAWKLVTTSSGGFGSITYVCQ